MTSNPFSPSSRRPPPAKRAYRLRPLFYQAWLLAAGGLAVWSLLSNPFSNLQARNISTGFGFLADEAGFAIGESVVAYSPTDTYGRALWVGVLNTLRVAAVGIVAATLLGTMLGIARLSRNWLVSGVAGAYIETMRNVPLLLHLLFWYALLTERAPGPRQAFNPFPGVYLSNRGLAVPWLDGDAAGVVAWVALAGVALCLAYVRWAARRRRNAGAAPMWPAAILLLAAPLVAWLAAGGAIQWQAPQLKGFNFQGGIDRKSTRLN